MCTCVPDERVKLKVRMRERTVGAYDVADYHLIRGEWALSALGIFHRDWFRDFSHDGQFDAQSLSFQYRQLDLFVTGGIIFQRGGLNPEPFAGIGVGLGVGCLCLCILA